MIKFFRKIRQKLLAENRFSKYLIYAIGEIILVMIGILLALQVNNWNEERQNHARVISIFKDIQEDLLNDIKEINRFQDSFYKNTDSVANRIIKGELTANDYLNSKNRNLLHFGLAVYNLYITDQSFQVLNENKSTIPEDYKAIVKDLNFLYNEYNQFMKGVINDYTKFDDSFTELLNNKPWYNTIIINNTVTKDAVNFYLSNAYKSNIYLYRDHLKNLNGITNLIKLKAIQHYLVLNYITQNTKKLPEEISSHLKGSLKMSEEYTCKLIRRSDGERSALFEQNGLLFSSINNFYFDKILLSEHKKDSLEGVMNNNVTIKFIRDNKGKIIELYEYKEGKKINEYMVVTDD